MISGFLFCLLVLATFYPLESKNEHSTEAATGSSQSSSLTLDVTSSVASVDLTVNSSTGTFASSDTNAAFSVTTNNFTGYTLSISADEDTGLLSDDEANTLSSIPAAISEETFSASTNTSYNGMWGYRPSKYNSVANTNYLPAPTTTASTLDVTSAANKTANNYTIALGARADFTKPASAYTNTFIITAVSNPINYVIKYNSNTSDTVTDMPAAQSSSTSATSIILSNNTPTREHYTFNGWCSVEPTTTNGDDVCNGGTVYLSGAVYGIDKTTLNDTTLYAMWNIDKFTITLQGSNATVSGTGTYNYGDVVEFTATANTSTNACIAYTTPTWAITSGAGTIGETTTSGNSSTIKFTVGDGNATITATAPSTNVAQTITLSRSNASSISIAGTAYTASSVKLTCGTYNITGAFASGYKFSSWAITGTNNSVASTSTLATTLTVGGAGTLTLTGKASVLTPVTATYMQDVNSCPSTMTTGTVYTLTDSRDNEQYKVARLADGKCWMMENLRLGSTGTMTLTPANTNITSNYTLPASGTANFTDDANGYTKAAINIDSRNKVDANGSKYGTYYNYCAASAGTYCYASGSGTGNATSDICPKGWRLPTGGASGEFGQLMVAYNISSNAAGSTTLQQTLKFPLAGYFYNGSANAQASSGPYWSSTYSSGTAMYYLGSNASTVNPQLSNDRYGGFLVRCVMNKYMQDVTAADVAAMAEGETAIMVDRRDDNAYTVAKINGNLWMTQNLDLPGGTTLTSADSNVTSNYTLPASSTSGFSDGNTAYIYNSNSTTCGNGSPCYSYYSYVAATAGTNPSSGDATSDICPKGWRLPTEAEMRTMARSYTTDATMIASPFLGVYAGLYDNSSFDKGGSYGYYWSSSIASSSTNASYGLYFYSSRSGVSNLHKKYGFSVRCVAKS